MGQKKSKPSDPMGGPKGRLPDIPPDSPLGLMIEYWGNFPSRKGKSKEKTVRYCMEVWGEKQIRADSLFWPIFGSFEDWICQALNIDVNSKKPFSDEESEYASLRTVPGTRTFLFNLKEKRQKEKMRKEEEIPWSPPPYVSPELPAAPQPASAPQAPVEAPVEDEGIECDDTEESDYPDSPGLRRRTRSQTKLRSSREEKLFPLREVPVRGPGQQLGVGYVSTPLNSGDVREFKREMGNLLEDPLGVSERLDQFLGPSLYTWEELQSILGILFTAEEREMIRRAGMRIWDCQHQAGPGADEKRPLQKPPWNNQNAEHPADMSDLKRLSFKESGSPFLGDRR